MACFVDRLIESKTIAVGCTARDWEEAVRKDIETLWHYWKGEELPPKLNKNDDMYWQCKFCMYKEKCNEQN